MPSFNPPAPWDGSRRLSIQSRDSFEILARARHNLVRPVSLLSDAPRPWCADLIAKGGEWRMSQYRKRRGNDTWHWCSNCTNYPTSDYDSSSTKPTSGELCNECKAKDKGGDCK
jgi:hypothetical protein